MMTKEKSCENCGRGSYNCSVSCDSNLSGWTPKPDKPVMDTAKGEYKITTSEQTTIEIKDESRVARIICIGGKFSHCDFEVNLSGNSMPDWKFMNFVSGKISELEGK